jgi:hypothetical protein
MVYFISTYDMSKLPIYNKLLPPLFIANSIKFLKFNVKANLTKKLNIIHDILSIDIFMINFIKSNANS